MCPVFTRNTGEWSQVVSLVKRKYDIKGKKILITGSTDGIGKQTAIQLAKMGGHVLVHGRNKERGFSVVEEIRKISVDGNAELYIADFASLSEVKKLSNEIHAEHDRLDILINNAGVFMNNRMVTEDGYEMTFAVNHLAQFLLTHLLLDLMRKSAPSRIINVSSVAHQRASLDFSDIQSEKDYTGYRAYALSKLANVLFTYELAERLSGKNITVNCLHPGVISTQLLKTGFGIAGDNVTEGAETPVYLASSPDIAIVSGKYFIKRRTTNSSQQSYDLSARKRLWGITEELVGIVTKESKKG